MVELNPSFFSAVYELGLVYYKLGEHEKAITTLEDALKIRPYSSLVKTELKIIKGDAQYVYTNDNQHTKKRGLKY